MVGSSRDRRNTLALLALDKMDEVELGSDKNRAQRGVRCTVTLECPDGGLDAKAYVVPTPKTYRAPSEKYLGRMIKGLRSFGYPESVLEEVRATAAREPLESDVHPDAQDLRQ